MFTKLPAPITLCGVIIASVAQAGSWQNSWPSEVSAAKGRCSQAFDQYQLQAICMDNEREGYQKMQGSFGLPPDIADKAKLRCARVFEQFQLQAICMENERDGYKKMQGYDNDVRASRPFPHGMDVYKGPIHYAEDHVEILYVSASRGLSAKGATKVFVKFAIKNKGEKSLKEVYATLYFLDQTGDTVHEITTQVVGTEKPLGVDLYYTRGKVLVLDNVPLTWTNDGSLQVKITNASYVE